MHRLFAALKPPPAMRDSLLALMGGIAHARWQAADQLHLTLRFIGEVDRHQAEDIAAALGSVRHPPFTLALDGIGQFDRKGRRDALWIGVTPQDPLKLLHNKIDRALQHVGIAPDNRTFLPHITIARFGRQSGDVGGFMETVAVPPVSCPITEFCLYESSLGSAGAVYDIIARYPLR
ncbi:MAG: RNA 2',3'-cyclic phosphodiesterase [Sphingomonadaceae bacterium]